MRSTIATVRQGWLAVLCLFLAVPAVADTSLIPRDIFFGNPDKASVRLSPDGQRLAWLAPVDGVLNVWIAPVGDIAAAKPITQDKGRGIRNYSWAHNNQHLLYVQDEGGDEDWHVYSVNLADGKTLDLTPMKKVAADIQNASRKFPDEILIGLNDRNPQFHDVYRVNIATGHRELVLQNTGFASLLADDNYRIRFGMKFNLASGGIDVLEYTPEGKWVPYESIPMEDNLTTQPVDFDKTGEFALMLDSRGRDTAALVRMNIKTKEKEIIATSDKADIGGAMVHPVDKTIEAVSVNYLRNEWQFFDKGVENEMAELKKLGEGEIAVTSRTDDDKWWTVVLAVDNGPARFYLYDRTTKKATFLFTNRKDLEGLKLAKMHPVEIPTRDGLTLVSYLSVPVGMTPDDGFVPNKPLPLVLYVHGGPWSRDAWGPNPIHHWLADRGYAVLSVNFRGSTGFGKKFINAGNREWGAKMHDDLLDAVQWAVKEKIADKDKVAIMGGSYGGYATLVGLTMTPDVFACGVDIVGPSNIATLLKTVPAYWLPAIRMFKDRVGDHTTDEGRKFLASRSPLTFVDQIKRPLLIGQGANDPRVKQSESDQIVQAMQSKSIPVTYALYPDEGHGFVRPPNRLSFFAIAEAFLAQHLGGRFEPVGDDFKESSVTVPTGAEGIPGLADALPPKS
jgi:dipeptidyl aminopeptidase/acylaminoacyl peptidase